MSSPVDMRPVQAHNTHQAIRIRGALQRLAVLHAMSLNLQPVHVARTGRRIVPIRALDQRDVIAKQPELVERVLELHGGAQAGCFGHFETDAALNAGRAEGLYMLTFRWDGDGSGWGLILVYEPEVEGVGHRLTTTALPMPVFPDD